MPDALRGPVYDRLRDAWAQARRERRVDDPKFEDALVALARLARARDLDATALLKAIDAVIAPEKGGEPGLDWDSVRGHAGTVAIRAYYRDD